MTSRGLEHRYARNFNSLSPDEQHTLGRAKVLIVGLGGLGGGVCEMLARTGVGHLTVADGDDFEASNLNRQILCREHLVGTSKSGAAKERIAEINSEIFVTPIRDFLDPAGMEAHLSGKDLVVDCLDTIGARFMLQDAAKKAGVPIVSGAIAGMTGQVTTIFPEDQGFELIYGPREKSRQKGVETGTGNIACCALMTASVQASECIKVLLNRGDLLRNKLLIMELWSNTYEVMALA